MKIKFRILDVQPQNRGIVVRYFTDVFDDPSGNLFVTIYPDPMPTGKELEDYIMSYAPSAWLIVKSKAIVSGLPDMTEMATMKDASSVVERDADEAGNINLAVAPTFAPGEF